MQYKYCGDENFEDLSSGRVLIHRSGATNFPVRLSQEIFCRCLSYIKSSENLTVYDPCCGGGYLLTVLGFLNPFIISALIGSDIEENAVQLAGDNLTVLSAEGIKKRKEHLLFLYEKHTKQIYAETLKSAERLSVLAEQLNIKTRVFTADALKYDYANADFKADIIITDVPYGNLTSWQGEGSEIHALLDNLIPCLKPESILAICSDKSQKINNTNYKRLEKQLIGKRKFEILKLALPQAD